MAELIEAGHYRLGRIEDTHHRDPPKEIGVIRGDVANESNRMGFDNIIGVSQSKWFVYELVEYTRKYHDNTGTGVLSVVSLKMQEDSKGDAVERAERRYNL